MISGLAALPRIWMVTVSDGSLAVAVRSMQMSAGLLDSRIEPRCSNWKRRPAKS